MLTLQNIKSCKANTDTGIACVLYLFWFLKLSESGGKEFKKQYVSFHMRDISLAYTFFPCSPFALDFHYWVPSLFIYNSVPYSFAVVKYPPTCFWFLVTVFHSHRRHLTLYFMRDVDWCIIHDFLCFCGGGSWVFLKKSWGSTACHHYMQMYAL